MKTHSQYPYTKTFIYAPFWYTDFNECIPKMLIKRLSGIRVRRDED